jgi:hypothetical protein
LLVEDGEDIQPGQPVTAGPKSPRDILRIEGQSAVQRYMVDEVQGVYRSQGVKIHDKHIETIIRQMLRKVRVDAPGDTDLLPGELIDRLEYERVNNGVLAEGGEPATASPVLLGVTRASLSTDSFLAAASFQETARVLTDAAVNGSVDRLMGLKENVIIGRLIPARIDQTEEGRARLGIENEPQRTEGQLTGFTQAPATFEEALAAISGPDVGFGAEPGVDVAAAAAAAAATTNGSLDSGDQLAAAASALAGAETRDENEDAAVAAAAEALRKTTTPSSEQVEPTPEFAPESTEDRVETGSDD